MDWLYIRSIQVPLVRRERKGNAWVGFEGVDLQEMRHQTAVNDQALLPHCCMTSIDAAVHAASTCPPLFDMGVQKAASHLVGFVRWEETRLETAQNLPACSIERRASSNHAVLSK